MRKLKVLALLACAMLAIGLTGCKGEEAKGCRHEYVKWDEWIAPTCESVGVSRRVCALCGREEYDRLSALGHQYDIILDGDADGCRKSCTVCKEIALFEHDYLPDELTCEVCGYDGYADLLTYEFNGEGYTVRGSFTYGEGKVRIPYEYNGLPVTKIADHAFYKFDRLEEIIVPWSVKEIGVSAFGECSALKRALFQGVNLEAIKGSAFKDCTALSELEIPDSVKELGDGAFMNCSSLTGVTLPSKTTTVYSTTFAGCSSLTNIGVHPNNFVYKSVDGNLYSADGATLVRYAPGKTATSFSVPTGVTKLEAHAFHQSENLTSITLPASVESVEDNSFRGCKALTAFEVDPTNDKYEAVDGNLYRQFGERRLVAYAVGKTETSFSVPAGVRRLGWYAFEGSKLEEIHLPASLDGILFQDHEFTDCDRLRAITVDEENATYKSVGGVLYNKDGTVLLRYPSAKTGSEYTVPAGVTEIRAWAFDKSQHLEKVVLPTTLTSLRSYAFENCPNLQEVTVAGTDLEIMRMAFNECSRLSRVTLQEGVKTIGVTAFYGTPIAELVIPESVTTIGSYPFGNYENTTGVTFLDPNGWKAGSYEIDPALLSDPQTAVETLKKYSSLTWTKG